MIYIYIVFFCFFFNITSAQFAGKIVSDANSEVLSNVYVNNLSQNRQAISNSYGFFSIKANVSDKIKLHSIGFQDTTIIVTSINLSAINNIKLRLSYINLNSIEIKAQKSNIANAGEFGKIRLSASQIKDIPMVLGEKDPLRALQFLPGIQEVSEGSAMFSVRGGNTDQNLLILDEAVVYNANHLFGFFSTFNTDAIKSLDAYKSAFPAEYGGRLSSIIDVRMRDGNKEKYEVNGGVGLLSSRLLVEGPIKKGVSSFLISGRRTYADVLLKPFQSKRDQTSYFFYDLNAKLNFDLKSNLKLYISWYTGKDKLLQASKIPRTNGVLENNNYLNWGNSTFTTRINQIINAKNFQNFSIIISDFKMIFGENRRQDYRIPPFFFDVSLKSGLQDIGFKWDLDNYAFKNQHIRSGIQITQHNFNTRNFSFNSSRVNENFEDKLPIEKAYEAAAYTNLKGDIGKFIYSGGIRLSYFANQRSNFEPRLSIGFNYSNNLSFSVSYSRMAQYIHLISNTGNGLPTDTWLPSSSFLKPGQSDHFNFNISKSFGDTYSLTFDIYKKNMFGNLEYRNGSNFLKLGQGGVVEPFKWEENLYQGKSWAYGSEFFLQKLKGNFTGMLGYSLGWSISSFKDLNNGVPFYNRQDRRHILEGSASYSKSSKYKYFANFVFMTGNALNLPVKFGFREDRGTNFIEFYNGFNTLRADNYFRVDLGVNVFTKKRKNYWEFAVYNGTNRKNPYFYDVAEKYNLPTREFELVKIRKWLFPVLPSITYNYRF